MSMNLVGDDMQYILGDYSIIPNVKGLLTFSDETVIAYEKVNNLFRFAVATRGHLFDCLIKGIDSSDEVKFKQSVSIEYNELKTDFSKI